MSNSRRDKGEGSIYQRSSDNKWVARYKAPNSSRVKVFYGKSEREVKNKLKEFKNNLIKNDYIEVKKLTVKQYVDEWLYNIKVNELKPKSFDRSESALMNSVYPYIGELQIASLSVGDIQRMVNELIKKDLSYATIHRGYVTLNNCFKLGIIKGELIKNPCVGVVLPTNKKKKSYQIKHFTEIEVEKICQESVRKYNNGKSVYRLGYLIPLLLYTGIRIGECLALKWDDINFEDSTIMIRRSITVIKNRNDEIKTNYSVVLQDTVKTDSSNRTIYINKKAHEMLLKLKEVNGKFDYVACSSYGNLINPRNIDRMFRSILVKCDIEPCGVHTCRHTFASMLFKKGATLKSVSNILGHSSINVTASTYIHLVREQEQQTIELLDDL